MGGASDGLAVHLDVDLERRRLPPLAGLGVGLWSTRAELRQVWRAEREFSSAMSASARRKRLASWDTALRRTLVAPGAA